MRKPRDFDAELKALGDKARQLKEQKLRQLGELVIATGADVLALEELAGALIAAAEAKDAGAKENWRKCGAAFFQRASTTGNNAGERPRGAASGDGGASPPAGQGRS